MSAFAKSIEVTCRSCGATHAPASRNIERVCQYCWDNFTRHIGRRMKPTKQNFTRWLARALYINVERMKKFGVAGRCEAIAWANGGWKYGYDRQCRHHAVAMRDGRRVCGRHAVSGNFFCVGTDLPDPYVAMTRVMIDLSIADPRFRQCVTDAHEAARMADSLKSDAA